MRLTWRVPGEQRRKVEVSLVVGWPRDRLIDAAEFPTVTHHVGLFVLVKKKNSVSLETRGLL